jgi:hypothetical protein
VPARYQKQVAVTLKEKAARVGQSLLLFKGKNARCGEQKGVNHNPSCLFLFVAVMVCREGMVAAQPHTSAKLQGDLLLSGRFRRVAAAPKQNMGAAP